MKLLMTALLSAMISTTAQAEMIADVPYGDGDRNKLDLYLPDQTADAPLVLFIHGGRWMRNDKDQVTLLDRATALNAAGIAVASMNYTYSTEAAWPAQRDDVMAALAFLSESGSEFGYDADRMAVWGQSSGAHLALWAGIMSTKSDVPDLEAVVAWYAPSDLSQIASDRLADDVPGGNEDFPEPTPESRLVGASIDTHPDLAKAASPLEAFKALPKDVDVPPIMLMHGDSDVVVSPLQSQRLLETLQARGTDATLTMVAGASHGGPLFAPKVPQVIEFLTARFGLK